MCRSTSAKLQMEMNRVILLNCALNSILRAKSHENVPRKYDRISILRGKNIDGTIWCCVFEPFHAETRPRQIVISCLLAVLVVDFTLCQVGKRKIKVFCEVKLIGILQISFRNL